MAFCIHCGATIAEGAQFCAACGKSQAAQPGQPAPGAAPPAASTGMTSNVAGALAYLFGFITGILFLVLEPYNKDKFVRFHAFQSIFLSVAIIAVEIVLGILTGLLAFVFWFLWPLLGLAIFVLWLFMMYKAYSNEKFKLPIIGDQAERMA